MSKEIRVYLERQAGHTASMSADASTRVRHTRLVRSAHWIVTLSFLTLLVTGFVILMAHPRLYWGETGNDLTPALLELPISRNHQHGGWAKSTPFFSEADSPVGAVRTFKIFNQNSWGRSLHFLAASVLVLDSIDMLDALHPQALLAYGMNGRDLTIPGGAPLRLRVTTQLGYKSMKYIQRIVVKDEFDDGGDKGNPKGGWAWYAGI